MNDTTTSLTHPTTTTVGALRRWYGPLVCSATWKDTAALVVALPVGVAWFTLAVTGLSVAAALMVTVAGLPILMGCLQAARRLAAVERRVTGGLLDAHVGPPEPLGRDGSAWTRARRVLRDRVAWRGVAYALVSLPIGIVTFTAAVVVWSVAAALVAFPVYQVFMSDSDLQDVPDVLASALHGWGRVGATAGVAVTGLVLLAVAPRIVHRLVETRARMVRRCFKPLGER